MKFRKKPVEIEAVEVNDALHAAQHDWQALPAWLGEAYERGGIVFAPDGVHISTLEGNMLGSPGDWIIKGVKGELYPCKPDIFAASYDRV